ncbi:TonB-dependent receptor [Granulicella sibirica]|uniref:Oar protein n=1 Tax=Granulicella sibirica TaxID=2479048 RepID=A0A4Q0T3F8_9BACT|nr:TonB-dependent receptor [Granulicella sibirica]RXH58255.1 Oar protein [Granulicella sibirica]
MIRANKITHALLLVLLLISSFVAGSAQSNYGVIRGIVSDPIGASVSGAMVVLTSQSTKIPRNTTTNGSGEYVFSAVEPGTYTLTVTGNGFKKEENTGIVIDSGNTIPLDIKLQIGSMTESVEVTASEPLVNNGTSYNGQLIDSQKLENLPNPGRNPFLFSKLDNNVTPVGDPRFVRFQDQSGSSTISIAGAPISSNNYSIDGVPITDFSNRAVIIPSIEAVEEVKVQANTYDAEIGRTSGGMFNTTLKSGGSSLHGVLQGETRQTNWGANLFFNNRTPYKDPVTGITQSTTPRGAAEFYSYVGAIGGPIPLPHWMGGKDKTFFWVAEEGYRQRSPITTNAYIVPTDLQRSGNFSEIGTVTSPTTCGKGSDGVDAICITNPATGQFFANNTIPASSINPVGQAIVNTYPHANLTATYGNPNFNGADTLGDRADEFDGKLTHQFGTRWLADFYYLHYGSKEPGGNSLESLAGSSSSYLLYRKVDATSIQNTITINPTTLLTVGFGFNRFPNNTLDISNGFNQSSLGFPANYTSALTKAAFPQITTDAGLSPEGTANSGPAVYFSRNFVVGVSKSLGKHSLKTGYVYRAISVSFTNISNGNGTFAFDKSLLSTNGSTSATAANILLGYPTSASLVIPAALGITTAYQATYLQDDWRVTPKLTLNLGFRYEYEPGVHERNNHYAVGFDRGATYSAFGTGPTATGGVEFAGQNGYGTQTGNMGNKYSPRAGFAYALDDATVVRGGAGVFYYPIVYSTSPALAPGYVLTNSLTNAYTNASSAAGLTSLSNPFPNVQTKPVGNANGLSQNIGTTLTVVDQTRRSPIYESYSFGLDHQFAGGIAFKIGYVGGHGRNIYNSLNINQLPDQYLGQGPGTLSSTATSFAYAGIGAFPTLASGKVKNYQTLLPFSQYQAISDSLSNGRSDYNALDVKVQKSFSRGVTVLASYTWSSNWDNLWGAGSTLNPGNNGPQDAYNLSHEYSRSINDLPQRGSIAVTYELPFGKGKQFMGNANRWVNTAVGGWRFNDITIIQSGGALPIGQGSNPNSSFGNAVTRPSLVGPSPCKVGAPEGRLDHYFLGVAEGAYTTTNAGFYGNAPRTSGCYGPGYLNSDLSLNKDFVITERIHAEFRAEALNAFNTPQFNGPTLAVDSSSHGQITSTLGFPRLIQLGGRLSF